MHDAKPTPSDEATLRERLNEALAVIDALRSGAADAQMVKPPGARPVFQLEGTDSPYRALVENMHEGVATVGADGTLLYGNEALASFFRTPLIRLIGSPIMQLVAPEHSEALQSLLRRGSSDSRRSELRLIAPGGSHLPALVSAVPLRGVDEPDKVALLIVDLSQREESAAMRRLLTQAAQLSALGEKLHSSLSWEEAYKVIGGELPRLLPDTAGALMVFEDALSPIAMLKARWGAPLGLAASWERNDCQSVRRGQLHLVGDAQLDQNCVHFSGAPPQRYECVPLSAQGELIGVLHVQHAESAAPQVSETEQQLVRGVAQHIGLALANLGLRDQLKEQAIRDELTGMYNRYHEREWLEQELRRSIRYGRQFAVVMVDMDDFKAINDSHGHHVGDHVLKQVAALFKSSIRGSDIACRHGGDEFLLLLIEASADGATKKAQSLREAFSRITLPGPGLASGSVTASFGVAVFPDHAADTDGLLRAADAALYRAKGRGGNRVEVATPPLAPPCVGTSTTANADECPARGSRGGTTKSQQMTGAPRTGSHITAAHCPARDDTAAPAMPLGAARLPHQTTYDKLTGLRDRNCMAEWLEQELHRSAREQVTLGVILFDVDHFKRINDHHGHVAGDAVLRALAELILSQFRRSDVVCRYGGDEILALMPSASADGTRDKAHALLRLVAQLRVDYAGQTLGPVTVSAGIAIYPTDGPTSEALLRAADLGLYAAKSAGRNAVRRVADSSPSS